MRRSSQSPNPSSPHRWGNSGDMMAMAMTSLTFQWIKSNSRDMTPTRLLCLVNPVATGPTNANGDAYTASALSNWSHWKALQSHNDSTWMLIQKWGINCINSIPIFSITCGLKMSIGTSCSQDFMRSFAMCLRQSLPQSMPTGRTDSAAQDLAWDPNKLGLFGTCKSFPSRVQKRQNGLLTSMPFVQLHLFCTVRMCRPVSVPSHLFHSGLCGWNRFAVHRAWKDLVDLEAAYRAWLSRIETISLFCFFPLS